MSLSKYDIHASAEMQKELKVYIKIKAVFKWTALSLSSDSRRQSSSSSSPCLVIARRFPMENELMH